MPGQEKSRRATLRDVPSVDQLLRTDAARELRELVGIRRLTNIARSVTAEIRSLIQNDGDFADSLLEEAVKSGRH
jgi:hypothetical protein